MRRLMNSRSNYSPTKDWRTISKTTHKKKRFCWMTLLRQIPLKEIDICSSICVIYHLMPYLNKLWLSLQSKFNNAQSVLQASWVVPSRACYPKTRLLQVNVDYRQWRVSQTQLNVKAVWFITYPVYQPLSRDIIKVKMKSRMTRKTLMLSLVKIQL